MNRSSIKYIDNAYMYKVKPEVKPVSNPVIYAPFPKHVQKKSNGENINKALKLLLFFLAFTAFISYYFVSDSQKNMNILGKEIVSLSNENIELQNKLDNLNSFQKIDSIINTTSALDTARMVMEVPAVNISSAPKVMDVPVNYNWSLGY